MILDLIKEVLLSKEKIIHFQINICQKESFQLFLIKQVVDITRQENTTTYLLDIFTKEDDKYGKASFEIFSDMDKNEIESKIDEQITLCKYVKVKPYEFVKKNDIKPVIKEKGFDGHSLKDAAFIVADSLLEADKFDKGYINSSEIFINFEHNMFVDSTGNEFVFDKSYGQIEFIVTWKMEDKEEIELYKYFEITSLDSLEISSIAESVLVEASNRSKAIPTPSVSKDCKLMISNDYVKQYFDYFAYRCNVDLIFNNSSNYKENDYIQTDAEDKITITLEPNLLGSSKGMSFDKDGSKLKKLTIIENGIIKQTFGSIQKAYYLNKPYHGNYQNIVVNTGSLSKDDIEDEYIEIVSLSGFEIDDVTGDFGSEIRLAYLHKGKEKIAITKGAISGNVMDSINSVRISKTKKQLNNYIGPDFVLIDNVSFLKGE